MERMDFRSTGPWGPQLKDTVSQILHNPALWSESTIERTLHRFYESSPVTVPIYTFGAVRDIIQDYLEILSDAVDHGELDLDGREGGKATAGLNV